MNTLPKELKKYFRPITNFLLTVCMILAIGVAGVQAQDDDDPPVPDPMPSQYFFKVGDVKTNEITLAPGENFILKVGFTLIGPCDGATATILWHKNEILVPGTQVTNLIGSLLPFGFWNVISQSIGHLSFTQAMLGGFILPEEDGQGGYVETDYMLMEFQVNVPEGSTWASSTIRHQINSDTVDYSAMTFYGASLVDYENIPTFTVYNSEAADVDCPDLGLNIGDACDDGDANTENDTVSADCECVGTPIPLVGCENTSQYGSANASSPNPVQISTCNYLGEFSVITGIVGGYEYEFSGQENSSGNLAYITVRSGSSGGPVIGVGTSALTVTALSSENLYVHWNANADCGTASSCATTIVTCITCATVPDCEGVPGGPAQPGTACDDGDAGTVNEVYDADCNCGGGIPVAINDEACTASVLACGDTIVQSMAGSTASMIDDCYGSGTADIWFNFTSDGSQMVTVGEGGAIYFDAVVQLFKGDDCENLVEVGACTDGPENFTVTEAGNYYFRVRPYFSSDESGIVSVYLTCADYDCPLIGANFGDACDDGDASTFNDQIGTDCECAGVLPAEGSVCANALPVECNADPATFSSAASNAINSTSCAMGNNGLWFSFMGTGGDITVNSTATFDHEMSINTGVCDALVNVGCKDGSTGAETYTILGSVNGQMYYVYIAHWNSSNTTTGNITISLVCATPPACEAPTLALSVQNEAGEAIDGCIDFGSSYYVQATLAGGAGNDAYNVTINGSAAAVVSPNGVTVLGPINAGTNANVTAVGVQDGDCSVSASVNSPALCAPSNDACADATAIACGESLAGTTYGAAESDLGSPSCAGGTPADVFYTFEAAAGQEFTVTVVGADYDGVLVIYSGSCDDLTELDCADNGFSAGVAETITYTATEAGTITIRTYDWSSSRGSFTISVTCEDVVVYDCPDLEVNFGDACENADGLAGVIDTDCNCFVAPSFDCPDLEVNFGDACENADGMAGVIDTDCNCYVAPTFDCPNLEANFGDACENADGMAGVIDTDCNCYVAPPVFDCPEIEANFGDACENGDGLAGVIDTECNCYVAPPVFDCPDLQANFGDACELAEGMGILNQDCNCVPVAACTNFVYFISDHAAADGISNIYKVTVSGGIATMTYIATSDIEIHIAYNNFDNLIYAVSKHTNSYRTIDPYAMTPTFGSTIALGADYGEITAAVFAPNELGGSAGKLLFGSQNNNAIYSLDVASTSVTTYDTYSPVTGGDLAFGSDGMLYLATRSGNGLYENYPAPTFDVLIGSVPVKVTGLAITDTDELLVSAQGQSSLQLYSTGGLNIGSYALELGGESYTLRDGDMASGCDTHQTNEDECLDFKIYMIHTASGGGVEPLLEVTLNNDGTASYTTVMPNLGGHIGLSPDGGLLYNVGSNNKLKVVDLSLPVPAVIATLNIKTAGGVNISNFPTALVGADGTLYAGSHSKNQVYTIDPGTGIATPYGPSRTVQGGDLIEVNNEIWLITRANKTFTNVITGASFTVPVNEINGAVVLDNGNVLLADGDGGSLLKELNLTSLEVVATYDINLPLFNGDLAGGCILTGGGSGTDNGDCYATEVVEYIQGTSKSGGAIATNRTDASKALGAPERAGQLVFVSLGYGGSLTLAFDGAIPNGPGDDIEVVETSYGNPSCASYPEYADVYVSVDGVSFFFAKTICRTDGFVDISDAGAFAYVNYVRIVNNNTLSTTPDGFDVDGVVAIYNCEGTPTPPVSPVLAAPSSTLTSFPNPTSGQSEVVFVTGQTGTTLVEVYDMSGRNVATVFNAEAQKGQEYRLDFDGAALPNGVYIYRMTTSDETIINKFMIAK